MTTALKTKTRLAAALVLGGLLSACGLGGPDLSGVRAGPQAVHPSPSALAQSTTPAGCQRTTGGACISQ